MPYTLAGVGDVPGKPALSNVRKQAIADEWNANEAAAAAQTPVATQDDKIEALIEAQLNPQAIRDAAAALAAQRG